MLKFQTAPPTLSMRFELKAVTMICKHSDIVLVALVAKAAVVEAVATIAAVEMSRKKF